MKKTWKIPNYSLLDPVFRTRRLQEKIPGQIQIRGCLIGLLHSSFGVHFLVRILFPFLPSISLKKLLPKACLQAGLSSLLCKCFYSLGILPLRP